MQRPSLFESDGFIYWKNRFESYVKSKDLNLWHVITEGDFPPIQNNPESKQDEQELCLEFFKALHPKWRANVTTIEESKDLISLSLNELIGNLKVHELIIKKDSKIVKGKGERISLALKAEKESSDEESLTSGSEAKNTLWWLKTSREESEEDDEKVKDETCLMAQASSEICLEIDLEPDE
ncbi:hypothetical protein Tco_1128659 [Tanacetum coccineum]